MPAHSALCVDVDTAVAQTQNRRISILPLLLVYMSYAPACAQCTLRGHPGGRGRGPDSSDLRISTNTGLYELCSRLATYDI